MKDSTEPEIEQQLLEELGKLKRAVDYIEKASEVTNKSVKLLEEMNLKCESIEASKSNLLVSFDNLKSETGIYLSNLVKENVDTLKSQNSIQLDQFKNELGRLKNNMISSNELEVIRVNVQNQEKSHQSDLAAVKDELLKKNMTLRNELKMFKLFGGLAFFLMLLVIYIIKS